MVTVLAGECRTSVPGAIAEGDQLWLPLSELEAATGWVVKAEGACIGESCVPLPPGRRDEFVRDGSFNFTALWRHLDRPFAHDDAGTAWAFGETSAARTAALHTLRAPDFTLPDVDGREYSLSDFRGKKVVLHTWASW